MPFLHLQKLVPSYTSCQDTLTIVDSLNFPMWVRDSKCKKQQTTSSPPHTPQMLFNLLTWWSISVTSEHLLGDQWCFLIRILFSFGFISTDMVQSTSLPEASMMRSNSPWCFFSRLPLWNQYQASIPMITNCFLTTFPANVTLYSIFFSI